MSVQETESGRSWEDDPISIADRRRSERKVVRSAGKLTASEGERHHHGRSVAVFDLSLHGAGFTSVEPLTIGGSYGLQMSSEWLQLSSRVRVVSCRQRDDGQWDVGAEFA